MVHVRLTLSHVYEQCLALACQLSCLEVEQLSEVEPVLCLTVSVLHGSLQTKHDQYTVFQSFLQHRKSGTSRLQSKLYVC